jgi:hypothetical protein
MKRQFDDLTLRQTSPETTEENSIFKSNLLGHNKVLSSELNMVWFATFPQTSWADSLQTQVL